MTARPGLMDPPRPICLRADDSTAEPRVLTHPGFSSATSVCDQHPLFSVSLSGFLPTCPSGQSEPPSEAQCLHSCHLPGHTWTSTSLSVLDDLAWCLEILLSDSGLRYSRLGGHQTLPDSTPAAPWGGLRAPNQEEITTRERSPRPALATSRLANVGLRDPGNGLLLLSSCCCWC